MRTRMFFRCAALGIATAVIAAAQSPSHQPQFEVASVKLSAPGTVGGAMDGGPLPVGPFNRANHDPERMVWTGIPLKRVIQVAYDLPPDRITAPGLIDGDRYDILAIVPKGATVNDFRLMLQNLLAARFHFASHRETRQAPGYILTVAGSGLKMSESRDAKPAAPANDNKRGEAGQSSNALMVVDASGFPAPRPGNPIFLPGAPFEATIAVNGKYRATVLNESIGKITQFFGNAAGSPVEDRTGLTGTYDFHLEYLPRRAEAAPADAADIAAPGADLIDAVEGQLGLKMTPGKVPVEMLVADRADRIPTGN